MTDEEIAIKLAEHQKEIGSIIYRVKDLEIENQIIRELAISVKTLAVNMENMCKEQERQSERINILESKPAKNWEQLIGGIITATVGGVIGCIISMI
ncbi:MAG: hypothetical protein E7265_11810 [Lachnospiraceae bacterium]|nr:hypothetical protein [Lachnospiraceae bacterium]